MTQLTPPEPTPIPIGVPERYFLTKMWFGAAVPWFEQCGLRGMGLSLVEPIEAKE